MTDKNSGRLEKNNYPKLKNGIGIVYMHDKCCHSYWYK